MKDMFEINMSVIRENGCSLSERILGTDDTMDIEIIESRDGDRVPAVHAGGRRVFLHSRYDPVREAERFIAETSPEHFDLFIVMGFGFAFHIEALLKQMAKEAVLLVLEKDTAIVRSAMQNRDLRHVFQDSRFSILVDPDEDAIAGALSGKSTYRVTFITHRGSFQTDPDYYNNLKMIAKSYLSTKEVNIATMAKFEKAWSSNISRNIHEIVSLPGVISFYGKFRGFPAIIASAGPSLAAGIDFIRENSGKALIIAVDTSYGILKRHGIDPHFCISVDPQIINARYFEGDRQGSCILVADPTVHPSVFHLYKGPRIITGVAFPMLKWIEEITGEKGEMAYGGSVSTNAYDLAKRLGADPVVMVGQDLAFTDGLAHARGSYLDEQVFLRNNRFNNPLMFNRYQMTVLPPVFVKGIRSGKVHTNHKLMVFLNWFEKRNDPSLINATVDGAFIRGVRHIDADSLSFPTGDRELSGIINQIYTEAREPRESVITKARRLHENSRAMLDMLDTLIPDVKRAVQLSDQMLRCIAGETRDRGKVDYILGKLSAFDQRLESQKMIKDMIGFTIQRVIHTITEGYELDEETGSLPHEVKVAKRSLYLYKGLLEGCLFNKKILGTMEHLLRQFAV